MDPLFYNQISVSNASTDCRNGIRNLVLQNEDLLPDLITFGTDLTNKNHYKAVWIIEMLAEHDPKTLIPFVDQICKTMPHYKHESAIRGMSRVAYFLSVSQELALNEFHRNKLIEICLDWLIGDAKVAPKAYAMYALCHYAQKEDWIKEELRQIIDKDYQAQSAGYKAAAREILKRLV